MGGRARGPARERQRTTGVSGESSCRNERLSLAHDQQAAQRTGAGARVASWGRVMLRGRRGSERCRDEHRHIVMQVGQLRQIGVGHLPVSDDAVDAGLGERDCIGPELVAVERPARRPRWMRSATVSLNGRRVSRAIACPLFVQLIEVCQSSYARYILASVHHDAAVRLTRPFRNAAQNSAGPVDGSAATTGRRRRAPPARRRRRSRCR